MCSVHMSSVHAAFMHECLCMHVCVCAINDADHWLLEGVVFPNVQLHMLVVLNTSGTKQLWNEKSRQNIA